MGKGKKGEGKMNERPMIQYIDAVHTQIQSSFLPSNTGPRDMGDPGFLGSNCVLILEEQCCSTIHHDQIKAS